MDLHGISAAEGDVRAAFAGLIGDQVAGAADDPHVAAQAVRPVAVHGAGAAYRAGDPARCAQGWVTGAVAWVRVH